MCVYVCACVCLRETDNLAHIAEGRQSGSELWAVLSFTLVAKGPVGQCRERVLQTEAETTGVTLIVSFPLAYICMLWEGQGQPWREREGEGGERDRDKERSRQWVCLREMKQNRER